MHFGPCLFYEDCKGALLAATVMASHPITIARAQDAMTQRSLERPAVGKFHCARFAFAQRKMPPVLAGGIVAGTLQSRLLQMA